MYQVTENEFPVQATVFKTNKSGTFYRRNCRGNPRCISGLGESKWLGPKAAAAAEDAWGVGIVDPNEECRQAGIFVGLKNLGATCYVNSLLQLWFHNLKFRYVLVMLMHSNTR